MCQILVLYFNKIFISSIVGCIIDLLMKKRHYSLIEKSKSCGAKQFDIYQSQLDRQQQSRAESSSINIMKQGRLVVGTFIQKKNSKCCLSDQLNQMQLVMYDQHLSLADSQQKTCLGLYLCTHKIVVTTMKKVIIGRVQKRKGILGNTLQILDHQNKQIFVIKKLKCQISDIVPSCLGWLKCFKPVTYQIYDKSNLSVGKIQIYPHNCCSLKDRYQIEFPKDAQTKEKLLLMNAITILN